MIDVRFYLYDSSKQDSKGKDLSSYVLEASVIQKKLDGTISTYALTLQGLPFREEIEPTTKFIYEIVEDGLVVETIDMVLQNDVVEQPIMSENDYFIHRLTLADPAVICQQRVCDNIAVTYKLKDVNLSTTEIVDTTSTIEQTGDYNLKEVENTYADFQTTTWDNFFSYFGRQTISGGFGGATRALISYNFVWLQPSYANIGYITATYSRDIDIKNLFKNYVTPTPTNLTIIPPMLMCYIGEHGTTSYKQVGFLPSEFKITRTDQSSNAVEYYDAVNNTWVASEYWNLVAPSEHIFSGGASERAFLKTYNQNSIWGTPYAVYYSNNNTTDNSLVIPKSHSAGSGYVYANTAKKVVDSSYSTDTINPNTNLPYNRQFDLPIESGYSYSIDIRRKQYAEPIYVYWKQINFGDTYKSESQVLDVDRFTTISTGLIYVYATASQEEILTKSASINDCYYLFKKAVLTTYFKDYDGSTMMLDTPTPIDVDSDTRTLMEKTKVRENMYIQKNLWEIITEIGNYIHAKPYMTFARALNDDRVMLNFIKYGLLDVSENKGTNRNIFNSKFVEEYVSSLDAYVDNLMQIDSTITEYCVASSESEDYLVYNDNCMLKTKYPIMEIVKLEVIQAKSGYYYSTTAWKDITDSVFEYNVWKCLGIDTNVLPNRANTIYYHLGEKKIAGLQYLIPTPNNTQQYPFKKIIRQAFNLPDENTVMINDYSFRITYRTKDSVRTRVLRPDIRKYLVNTQYDYLPIHSQFRNQTDKIIDSEKYGDNLYGELIRTGNSVYEKYKWSSSYSNINNIGDLVRLDDGNLYYVSKVENMIFRDHIETNIEYTKDFNRLAQIIGIPSEPRFYEISEQSQVRREININQSLVLYTDDSNVEESTLTPIAYYSTDAINDLMWSTNRNALFTKAKITYKGIFKNYDTDTNSFDKTVYANVMWSVQNTTLTFECDMEDNFMVENKSMYNDDGNGIIPHTLWSFVDYIATGSLSNQAYRYLAPARYTDIYGRADSVIVELGYNALTGGIGVGVDTEKDIRDYIANNPEESKLYTAQYLSQYNHNVRTKQMLLNKDNREALSFNVNFSIITDSDRLVVSNKIWTPKNLNQEIKIVIFTSQELSKINPNINKIDYTELFQFTGFMQSGSDLYVDINSALSGFTDEELLNIKSIALCVDNQDGTYTYYMGRNISGLSATEIRKNWKLKVARIKPRTNTTQLNTLLP